MKHHAHGYTWFEIIGATAIALMFVFGVVALGRPIKNAQIARDDIRITELGQIQRAVLELSYTDKEQYDMLVETAGAGRHMLGVGENCNVVASSDVCSKEELQSSCLNLYDFGIGELVDAVPVDDLGEFNDQATGYYMEIREDRIVLGSCTAQSKERLELSSGIK